MRLERENHIFLHRDCCVNEGWGRGFYAGPDVGFYSSAASVKARSGLGGWTDGQGGQLLSFHHFETECLECFVFFNEKEILLHLADETGRTTICLVTIQMFFFFFSDFSLLFFFEKLLLKWTQSLFTWPGSLTSFSTKNKLLLLECLLSTAWWWNASTAARKSGGDSPACGFRRHHQGAPPVIIPN